MAGTAGAMAFGGLLGCGSGGSSSPASSLVPDIPSGSSVGPNSPPTATASLPSLPPVEKSGIDHIVVVMLENRSFNHLLGWLPGSDGMQAGLSYPDTNGKYVPTSRLGSDYQGCGFHDPDHTYDGTRQEYNNGLMDGFLRAAGNDKFAISYYAEPDLPFHAALARNFTTCSRYFSSFLGPTNPNRMFLHAAQTDRLVNEGPVCTFPTIWDRLADAKVPATYYYKNVSVLGIWGPKYDNISSDSSKFFAEVAAGQLPSVAFVEPGWSTNGDDEDEHPHANMLRGEHFLWKIYAALSASPLWSSTVLVITYDEGGGFFEHIPPPRAAAPNTVDPDIVNGKARLGFRVPTIIVSPWSRGTAATPRISSVVYDHTSILKMIEWRWGLQSLTARDASSDIANLAYALDFAANGVTAPELVKPQDPPLTPSAC